jgi:hypothetical protein
MIREAHAIYKKGRLIFLDKTVLPKDGTEVTIIFKDDTDGKLSELEAIDALYGIDKGGNLLEKLLESRREDREHDERNYKRLRS